MSWLFTVAFCLCGFLAVAETKFEIREGDRMAFIGGVFIEREQYEGHIETMLAQHFLDRNFTFRNLGWSGDTVETFVNPTHEARPKYVPTLLDYVEKIKPTVILISYGMMESFRGEAGLADFTKNYNALLDKLAAASRQSASDLSSPRFILISPFHHETLDGNLPEVETHNKNLQLYVNAIEKIARERNCAFVNLFDSPRTNVKQPLTSNGVHLNSRGYQKVADTIEKALGLVPVKMKREAEESLRAAIKNKNKQWWYHYRPMNSEYVYPNGTRFQDKIGDTQQPLDKEITAFAQLAVAGDAKIAEMRRKLSRNEKVLDLELKTVTTRPIEPDPSAPDPELERKSFQVADGFEVNLFAADPLINKPIQMAFDERGRLFVATTTLYPQIKPGEKATDKIIVLEDADGDGRADKTTVFADDLYIPTGVLPGNKGIYTFDDTTFLHLRDTDSDGFADEKEFILSGYGTEDSHHKGHVLRFGPGGNIYFNQGVFLHSTIETARGIVHHSGNWLAGIFEFQPASQKLEVYLASSVPPNPWGHYWNRWGFDFHIDSSGQQGSNFILPTANKTSSAIPVPGGEGKLAGGEIISGRHFPDDWQGNLIAAPFKENRVARWSFSDDGSGYAMKQLAPLIVSTDSAFRPVDMRMGPDGALYIADWYNPLIGHMQYHFRDPGRDFTHGRIWRVTAKNRPLVPRFNFAKASVKEILEQLKAPEDFNRAQARRILSERNRKEVLPALANWVKKLIPENTDYDHQRLEALWTYQTLNVVEPDLLKNLLRAKTPDARAAATAVLRYWHDAPALDSQSASVLDLLAPQIADENPRVRLQAVITLSYIPDARSMEIAARALDQPLDKYLDQALKNTANALKSHWLPALQTGAVTFGGNTKHLQYALEIVDPNNANKRLIELLRTEKNPEKYIGMLATLGDTDELGVLYNKDFEPALQAKALDALAAAARNRKIIPKVDTARLKGWMSSPNSELKSAAMRLADAWKIEEILPKTEVEKVAAEKSVSPTVRPAAGTSAETKEMSRAEMEPWVKEVQQSGDATRGEKIYRRTDLNCLGCHAISGAGGQLGPELGAVGSGSTIDYLIESILFPNKVIKDGFQTVEVTTKEDDAIFGVRVRENKDELVLKDATRNEIVIPTSNIKEKNERRTSLMPDGSANSLKHSELIDLVRFLSELGKPGAYANNPKAIVRKWQIGFPISPDTTTTWTTAYSFVSGVLPLDLFANQDAALARFQIDSTTAGKIQIKLNSLDGLSLTVDSKPVELKENLILDLTRGSHQMTFLVDVKKRKAGVRVELEEAPGSAARFQLAGAQ
ncbi:MAG: PVC-type heme-binding CxxCH protein [Verrucomicrobiota bacterium]